MSDRDFRLPKHIRPGRQPLRTDVDVDAWTFHGATEILLSVLEPANAVTLHAVELDVADARATVPDGTAFSARLEFNEEAETVTLRFDRGIQTFPRDFGEGGSTSMRNIIATIQDLLAIHRKVFSFDYDLSPERRR